MADPTWISTHQQLALWSARGEAPRRAAFQLRSTEPADPLEVVRALEALARHNPVLQLHVRGDERARPVLVPRPQAVRIRVSPGVRDLDAFLDHANARAVDPGAPLAADLIQEPDGHVSVVWSVPRCCADARTGPTVATLLDLALRGEPARPIIPYASVAQEQRSRSQELPPTGDRRAPTTSSLFLEREVAGGDLIEVSIACPPDLDALAKRHRVTPVVVLATALSLALQRAGADAGVAAPSSWRVPAILTRTVGPLTAWRSVASDLPSTSFLEALTACRRSLHHKHSPDLDPTAARIDVVVDHTRDPGGSFAVVRTLAGLEATAFSVCANQVGSTLHLRLHASARRFEPEDARWLLRAVRAVLRDGARSPQSPTARLALVSDADLDALDGLSVGEESHRAEAAQTLGASLAAHALDNPGGAAVHTADRTLTLAELDRLATTLAHTLIREGAHPGQVAAVLCEDPISMIVAIYGSARAGLVATVLDLRAPPARHLAKLRTCGAQWLLVDAPDLAAPLTGTDATVLAPISDPPTEDVDTVDRAAPEAPALLSWTSGSTGEPAAAVLTHAGLHHLGCWSADRFGPRPTLHLGSPAFDALLHNMAASLFNGAPLAFTPTYDIDPTDIQAAIEAFSIGHLCAVPSVLRVLDPDGLARAGSLLVVTAGEICPPTLASRWAERFPLHNAYGPTENTVASHCAALTSASIGERPVVPIGRPRPDVSGRIVDKTGARVPPGVTGELTLSGPGLAVGYLAASRLTAERFRPDPCGPPGSRRFHTGDRAVMDGSGNVYVVGRIDDRLKLRGQQVRPAQIGATLEQLDEVRHAHVTVSSSDGLVAYLEAEPTADYRDLDREHVARWLETFEDGHGIAGAEDEFAGWTSRYTGEPIPRAEMAEWARVTADRLAAWEPRRVLEIGCGTGAILTRLAPNCSDYWATDLSRRNLVAVEKRWDSSASGARLRLLPRAATDDRGIPARTFDLVVLNSVVQYFPSSGYLGDVLHRAVRATRDGGRVFVGDVRHKGLAPILHAAMVAQGAAPDSDPEDLRARIERSLRSERELLIDPRFFTWFAAKHDRVAEVRIEPRRGTARNELTRYRYDVVLGVGPARPASQDPPVHDWSEIGADPVALRAVGASGGRIRGVPNARLSRDLELARGVVDLGRQASTDAAVAPEAVANLLGRGDAWCDWSAGDPEGRFDIVVGRPTAAKPGPPDADWTNCPTHAERERWIESRARQHCAEQLPPYMQPARYAVLDRLPLNRSNKVDEAALPALVSGPTQVPGFEDPIAARVAEIWLKTLEVVRLDPADGFFEQGGHSLLATQLVCRINAALGTQLPVRAVFEAPSFEGILARIRALAPQGPRFRLVRRAPGESRVLSHAQLRIWLAEQFGDVTPVYQIPMVVRLEGPLSTTALSGALNDLTRRHDVLRTEIATDASGGPLPVVHESAWIGLDVARVEPTASVALADDAAVRFALEGTVRAEGPWRATLLESGPELHHLVLRIHHLFADGWSIRVLATDLLELYEARSANRPSTLPELPYSYGDYAVSERQWISDGRIAESLDRWAARLDGATAPDWLWRAPTRDIEEAAGTLELRIAADLESRAVELARRTGATLFMVLLAAWYAVLSRHGRTDDLTFGSPVANRSHEELEGVVGLFANTVALRVRGSGAMTFVDLVSNIRAVTLDAFTDGLVPFDLVVELVNPSRVRNQTPLIQLWFSLLDLELLGEPNHSLRLTSVPVEATATEFDLALSITRVRGDLWGRWTYATGALGRDRVHAMARDFVGLLEAAVATPTAALRDLHVAPAPSPHAAGSPDHAAPLLDRFRSHVTRAPKSAAMRVGNCSTTYEQLARRAEGVARALGTTSTPVALYLRPGENLVALLLGALMCGRPFVLLDPAYPADRLRTMIHLSRASLVVYEEEPRFSIDVDQVHADDLTGPNTEIPSAAPGGLAYICFTSGSTGQPKGVMVPRDALDNLVASMSTTLGLGPDDVWMPVTALSFDIALLEYLAPLATGGTLALFQDGGHPEPTRLAEALVAEQVTILQATPTLLQLLHNTGHPLPAHLTVVSGGEQLPLDLARALTEQCAGLYNAYGPTETTIWSTAQRISRSCSTVPIGRPLARTRCYVADSTGREAPDEAVGELLIGGVGVAWGYVQRPRQTAERFLPDPHGPPGSRLYRTGDLVVRDDMGRLHFVGREDQQIKLRGHRIELEEIELHLMRHPEVVQASVHLLDDATPARLIAICVFEGAPVDRARLRSHLAESLPAYMAPDAFVAAPQLPLLPNGKRDREALAHLAQAPAPAAPVRQSFANETERRLARLWTELLPGARVGPESDFFADLGGHSMLAVTLAQSVREEFDVNLPIAQVFAHRTLAAMAEAILVIRWATEPEALDDARASEVDEGSI